MHEIYNTIVTAKAENKKLLAVLLDPDKLSVHTIKQLAEKITNSPATHVFVGGSIVENNQTETIIVALKKYCPLPIIIFPGNVNQVTDSADAILLLSLLSGNNPEYLIGQHVKAAPLLHKSSLEIIPTGYILIDGGTETAVQRVSNTTPIANDNVSLAVNTALAGVYTGKKLIYLEAGSGAKNTVPTNLISSVANTINIPLIVGGGIRSGKQLNQAYDAGATLVVIGTAFENDSDFFKNL